MDKYPTYSSNIQTSSTVSSSKRGGKTPRNMADRMARDKLFQWTECRLWINATIATDILQMAKNEKPAVNTMTTGDPRSAVNTFLRDPKKETTGNLLKQKYCYDNIGLQGSLYFVFGLPRIRKYRSRVPSDFSMEATSDNALGKSQYDQDSRIGSGSRRGTEDIQNLHSTRTDYDKENIRPSQLNKSGAYDLSQTFREATDLSESRRPRENFDRDDNLSSSRLDSERTQRDPVYNEKYDDASWNVYSRSIKSTPQDNPTIQREPPPPAPPPPPPPAPPFHRDLGPTLPVEHPPPPPLFGRSQYGGNVNGQSSGLYSSFIRK